MFTYFIRSKMNKPIEIEDVPETQPPPDAEQPEAGDEMEAEIILSDSDFPTEFPVAELNTMHTHLVSISWRVPVQPKDQLETVLLACIKLAQTSNIPVSVSLLLL